MALVIDGPVPPEALTTFVRRVPVPESHALTLMFPERTFDTNEVDWAELTHTNRAAQYRPWDGSVHVARRDGGGASRVQLPPLSDSLNRGEYERLKLAFAQLGGTNQAALAKATYNDAEILTGNIHNRRELAWGDVLHDAKMTINEGGLRGEADYAMPADQVHVAAVPWTDVVNAKPLTDAQTWQLRRKSNGNLAAATQLMRSSTVALLRRNKEIIDAVHGATAGRTHVTMTELADIYSSESLPVPVDYEAAFDVDGTTTWTMPDGHVSWLPADLSRLGFWAWGVTATAQRMHEDSAVDFELVDGAGIVAVVDRVDSPPYREFTFVDACGMPVLSDARQLSTADVH